VPPLQNLILVHLHIHCLNKNAISWDLFASIELNDVSHNNISEIYFLTGHVGASNDCWVFCIDLIFLVLEGLIFVSELTDSTDQRHQQNTSDYRNPIYHIVWPATKAWDKQKASRHQENDAGYTFQSLKEEGSEIR
jgi:hypothetical protein